jgi:predicted butyrate kinase (DUF1464 family)
MEVYEMAEQTVKQWLEELASSTQSTEKDSRMMQNLLRRIGLHNAVVTCGIVYPSGYGMPLDIHSMARELLSKVSA